MFWNGWQRIQTLYHLGANYISSVQDDLEIESHTLVEFTFGTLKVENPFRLKFHITSLLFQTISDSKEPRAAMLLLCYESVESMELGNEENLER